MKGFKLLIACFFVVSLLGIQESNAQDRKESEKKIVYKTTKEKTPAKVKMSLKDYSNYDISNEVTYVNKKHTKIYRFRVEKGNWSHYLLIDESGKIMGIETGEH